MRQLTLPGPTVVGIGEEIDAALVEGFRSQALASLISTGRIAVIDDRDGAPVQAVTSKGETGTDLARIARAQAQRGVIAEVREMAADEAKLAAGEEIESDDDGEKTIDPASATVPAILAYAQDHPDEVQSLIDAETEGKNRATLVAGLEAVLAGTAETGDAD
jgi:hypothetical protein